MRGVSTEYIFPSGSTGYLVSAFAFVQDAVTGQNATTPSPNGPVFGSSCNIQPTGFTHCYVAAPYGPSVPSGHPYKVTVFVTNDYMPCSLQKANLQCTSQLLAPNSTITVAAGTWGTTSNSTSTTVSSSTTSAPSSVCGQPPDTILNWAPGGNDYIKVVTDQGAVITNGTLIVTQAGNATEHGTGPGVWNATGLTEHYWITLEGANRTGYLSLSGGGTDVTVGYFNVTLVAGYNNQGPCYTATIPMIQVTPNSTVYVTVSVPSGVVTVVTTNEVSGAVTTTTTSATTTKNGG